MEENTKVLAIIAALQAAYPEPRCALEYQKDYELMVAVRLSAQCTDARVNEVTPVLFAAYPTLEALANADIAHVEELVHSCGFYKNKAREIVLACRMLLTDYGGKVPGTMQELLRLPGVGRKTANLLLGDLYHAPRRCGLRHPLHPDFQPAGPGPGQRAGKVERQLRAILPPEESSDFATGWCSTAGRCAQPGVPNAAAVPWPPHCAFVNGAG